MSFLLDTDICSAYLKGDRGVFNRFVQYGGSLHASVITFGELFDWVLKAEASSKRRRDFRILSDTVTPIEINVAIALRFAALKTYLSDVGLPVEPFDLLIAATALECDLTLVAHNLADFANILRLNVVDWLTL